VNDAAGSGRGRLQNQEANTMYPRQIENVATQHVQERRSQRLHRADRSQARAIRAHAGWTLIAVGLRLASSAGR
jgi:hypothetical protein